MSTRRTVTPEVTEIATWVAGMIPMLSSLPETAQTSVMGHIEGLVSNSWVLGILKSAKTMIEGISTSVSNLLGGMNVSSIPNLNTIPGLNMIPGVNTLAGIQGYIAGQQPPASDPEAARAAAAAIPNPGITPASTGAAPTAPRRPGPVTQVT